MAALIKDGPERRRSHILMQVLQRRGQVHARHVLGVVRRAVVLLVVDPS
jgi:hypothetical protein